MMRSTTLMVAAIASLVGCGGADGGGTTTVPGGALGGTANGDIANGSSAAQGSASIEDTSPECASYRGYTAALAKATIDCLGTVNPFLYGLNEKGLLERRFDACTTGGSKPSESPGLLHIDRLLSLQLRQATLPNVVKCIPEVYARAQRAFVQQGNSTCPMWRHESTKGLPTRENVQQSVENLPRLTIARGIKPAALSAETFHFYSVDFQKEPPGQPCGSAETCARACTAVFPGFYVGMSEKQLIGDPYWWLDPTDYGGFDAVNDPYWRYNSTQIGCASPAGAAVDYCHPMSYAGDDVPGDIYGDFGRAAFADPNTVDVDHAAELCTRWDGTDHVVGRLVQDKLIPDDPTTWMSRCDFYPQGGIDF